MSKIFFPICNYLFQTGRLPIACCLLLIGISSCKKITTEQGTVPFNPYDTVNYNSNVVPDVPIDSNSFLGIHKYILSVKCAVNGCHDGSFEPDYRTVQSAYSTLVYAPVVKNTSDSFYTYRVVPNDTAHSWLWFRLTTTDQNIGRMPLYDTLYPAQREKIKNWIMSGARDLFGNSPAQPTYTPSFYGLVAYLPDQNNFRVDTIRGGIITNPFAVIQGNNVQIWWGLYDDITLPFSFTYNKVKFSTDPFNFDNAVEVPLQQVVNPHFDLLFGYNTPFFNYCIVNTSQWSVNDIVYMRVYVQDSDHSTPTELPDGGSLLYLLTYCAFIIQ